jgi:polyisoprenoid-binding protein YceI
MFQKAAGLLERVVLKCIGDACKGDGFIPVGSGVKAVSWEALGFPLPPEPKKEALESVDIEIPHQWVLKKLESDKTPMVQFRFPAPLDNYSGEAKKGSGEFELSENLNSSGAKGSVVIDTRSVTMGDPDLDKVIQSSLILNTKEYPVSKFTIEKGNSESQTLSYGSSTPVVYQGMFTLKEKSVPLTATVEIEPVLGDKGEPFLIIRGGFEINLKDFMIDGPDGPEPANHTLLFDVNFTLAPKTK